MTQCTCTEKPDTETVPIVAIAITFFILYSSVHLWYTVTKSQKMHLTVWTNTKMNSGNISLMLLQPFVTTI